MTQTDFRTLAAEKDLRLGTLIMEFTSPGIGDIAKDAGCDFVFVDMEHSGFGFDTIKSLLKYLDAAGLPALVRTPSNAYIELAMACDMGAKALSVPHLRGVEDARTILSHIKFPPEGKRGVALGIAHDRYRSGGGVESMAAANRSLAFYPTIEDIETVAEVDEIVALDGVDGILIGHNDLSASMGLHGQYEHPDFVAALAEIEAACTRHGKSYVRVAFTLEDGVEYARSGVDMLIYSGDIWLYKAALAGGLAELRAQHAERPAVAGAQR
jgi:2-dehydro-3-deoxyglucarate aldolase/4-hydroxy-2-oxoheptanedioate aldolase